MKLKITKLIEQALSALQAAGKLPKEMNYVIKVDATKQKEHGDFASNIALMLAKSAKMNPRDLAKSIIDNLPAVDFIEKTQIAGPGFINFYLHDAAAQAVIKTIFNKAEKYGLCDVGSGKKINVEYVSANPNGPLHVGHGRGAAFGSVLSNLLKAAGFDVYQEYYVNDAGRQMNILAISVWLRYLELCGETVIFPVNGYCGEYVKDIAQKLFAEHGAKFHHAITKVLLNVPDDEAKDESGKVISGDKEAHVDGIIINAKELLQDDYKIVFDIGLDLVLEDIKDDLLEFKIEFDKWFSEKSLVDSKALDHALERLVKLGLTYEKDGAIWFKSTNFGDEKDRVLVRDNGITTYFASDAAYLLNKMERGFDEIIYILGADHHGYIPRLRALMSAFEYDANKLKVPLVQFASLYRDGKPIEMSTRKGEFVTIRQLRDEVGCDAARFFYVMRKMEQHLDFDLDLAKSKSNENPVYYIQYAHARICSVMRQLAAKNLTFNKEIGLANVELLTSEHEKVLLSYLAKYPETIKTAALREQPHLLAYYLRQLAQAFHTYYNNQQFLVDDAIIRNSRLALILAVKQVLENALTILGISAPETM